MEPNAALAALDTLIAGLADDFEDAGEISALYRAMERLEALENEELTRAST
jgi:hypothetical protein